MVETTEFDSYLKEILNKFNSDDEIFFSYIKGILETDETPEEKTEGLTGIFAGIAEDNIEEICSEILAKWSSLTASSVVEPVKKEERVSDDHLVKLLSKQTSSLAVTTKQKPVSAEKSELKKSILAQYNQVSDEEEECAGGGKSLAKNVNAATVEDELKKKREQNKQDHKIKKQKDKDERDKQKAKAEERKEKEKKRTQKGERRR